MRRGESCFGVDSANTTAAAGPGRAGPGTGTPCARSTAHRRSMIAASSPAFSAATAEAAEAEADDDDDDDDGGDGDVVAAHFFFFPSPRRRPSSLIRYGAYRSPAHRPAHNSIGQRRVSPMRIPRTVHNTPRPLSAPVALNGDQTGF